MQRSKTFNLIKRYRRILKEQGELPPADEFNTTEQPSGDVTDNPDASAGATQEEMPMSSEGENQYISDLIDAALFEPSPDDSKVLADLQSIMKMKKYTNAREEVLPTVLNIIRPSTESNDIRKTLDTIE